MLRVFQQWAHKKKKHLELFGVDANPHIIDYARKNLKGLKMLHLKQKTY